jgi:imidazole glycerol-phosphate synthase subunit HisF
MAWIRVAKEFFENHEIENCLVMLKIRVIPTLLWKDENLVKGMNFESWRQVATILPAIKVYNIRQVDELVFLDIAATPQGRQPDYDIIQDFSSECFVPLTVGGGITKVDHIRKLLAVGADKVVLNSVCYDNKEIVEGASKIFGAQCIVVGIDFKLNADGRYECYKNCGQVPTGIDPVRWAKQMEDAGAGELLVTSIDHDGCMDGYDLELISQIAAQVRIPLIASGGAGSYSDFHKAIGCGASAVAAASIYHFTAKTPKEAKIYLDKMGIPVRQILKADRH